MATTHVEQLFRNDNNYTVEGTYIFPIPAEAAVNDFAMWIDGERVAGKVLSAEQHPCRGRRVLQGKDRFKPRAGGLHRQGWLHALSLSNQPFAGHEVH